MDSPEIYSLPRYIAGRADLLLMIKIRETNIFEKREIFQKMNPFRIAKIINLYGGHSDDELQAGVAQLTEAIDTVINSISIQDLKDVLL